jgi:hypothetical protein
MLVGMRTIGVWVGSNNLATTTVDLDFAPVYTGVTVSISRLFGGGDLNIARAGILNYRFRNPDGSDSEVDFPAGPNDPINALPAAVWHDQMTHVTMQLLVYDTFTRCLMTAFHWD